MTMWIFLLRLRLATRWVAIAQNDKGLFVILSFRKKAKYPLVKPHFAVKKNTQAMQILFYDKTKINLILTHAFDFKKHLNFKALKTLNFLIKM